MVVSQKHPEWTRRALKWLNKIFEHPELSKMLQSCHPSVCRFLSFGAESAGVGTLLNSAMDIILATPKQGPKKTKNDQYIIVDTQYTFVDGK